MWKMGCYWFHDFFHFFEDFRAHCFLCYSTYKMSSKKLVSFFKSVLDFSPSGSKWVMNWNGVSFVEIILKEHGITYLRVYKMTTITTRRPLKLEMQSENSNVIKCFISLERLNTKFECFYFYIFFWSVVSIPLCFWKSMKKIWQSDQKEPFFIMHLLSFLFNFKPHFFDVFSTHNMDFHCFFFFFL